MSLFEECLTLGPWLAEEERLDLYKFLLLTRHEKYRLDGEALRLNGLLETSFANGSISYSVHNSQISYRTKRLGEPDYGDEVRTLPLGRISFLSASRMQRFFAQAELDVLKNYPNPGKEIEKSRGYGINLYPYYDLNYYSKGRGKVIGFFNRLRRKDGELLQKLLES